MNDLTLLSTAALEKIARRTYQGSPEWQAMQKELQRRKRTISDKQTPLLFTASELEKSRQ